MIKIEGYLAIILIIGIWTAIVSAFLVPPIIGGTAGLASESENR
jgi:hypothetical protein